MPPSLPHLPFRGFRPRALPEALPYSILRGLSRPREAALRLVPVRSGGAAHRARGAAIAAGKVWALGGTLPSWRRTSAFALPIRYNRAAEIWTESARPHGANCPHAGMCR